MEQFHGLVAADAELALEGSGVGIEGIVHGDAPCAQLLLEPGGILAEVGEVGGDALVGVRQRVEPIGLARLG